MRLIDADELKKAIVSNLKKASPHFFRPFEYGEIIDIIESQPTIKLTVDNIPRCTHNVSVETRWDGDDIKTPLFTQGMKKIIQATEKLAEKGKYRGVDDDL